MLTTSPLSVIHMQTRFRPVSYTHLDVYKRQHEHKQICEAIKNHDALLAEKCAREHINNSKEKDVYKRQSIHTSVVPIEWDNVKINILDTPGFFDFVGEVEEAVSAADAAIIVVSGKAGIQTGTCLLYTSRCV